ncbi:MAG: hypothetical protein ACRD2T_09255 [Thermoanaerobaculia bacterium]
MKPGRGKSVALVSAVLAVLVVLGFAGSHLLREPPTLPGRWSVGQKLYISEGQIPVRDFIQFLSDFTGRAVIPDGDVNLEEMIRIADPIPEADAELVRAIFEVNRLRTTYDTLPSGEEVLRVTRVPRRARARAPAPPGPR